MGNALNRRQQRRLVEFRRQQQDIYGRKYGFRIPLYFGWELVLGAGQVKDRQQHLIRPFHTYRGFVLVTIGTLLILVASGIFFTNKHLRAATYTWVQSAWTGGATASVGVHPTNQTGWTQYSSKDSNVSAGATVSLTSSSASHTETSDTDFNAGTKTSTEVTGTGSTASLQLASSEGSGTAVGIAGMSGGLVYSKSMVYESVTDSTWYIGTFASKIQLVQFQGDGTSGTALGSVDLSSYSLAIYYNPVWDPVSGLIWFVGNSSGAALHLFSVNPSTRTVTNNFTLTGTGTGSDCGFFVYDAALDAFWISYDNAGARIIKVNKSGTIITTITPANRPRCSPNVAYADSGTNAIYYLSSFATSTLYKQPKDGSAGSSAALTGTANTQLAYDSVSQAIWVANAASSPNGVVNKVATSNLGVTTYSSGFVNGVNGIAYDSYHQQILVSEYTGSSIRKVRLSDGVVSFFVSPGVSSTYFIFDSTRRVLWSSYPMAVNFVTYASPGSFASQIFDTGNGSAFSTLTWNGTTPASTTLTVKVRTSNSATMVGAPAWASCTAITSGQALSTGGCATDGHRYVQYYLDLTSSVASKTPLFSDITINYTQYTNGTLTSSVFDTVDSANVVAKLEWTTSGTGTVKFQLRTSADNNTWSSWLGPTGTGDYYTDNTGGTAINSLNHDGSSDRYIQYKAFLTSADGSTTPSLTSTTLTYVVNAPPEIQASPTATQNSDGTVTINYAIRDTDSATDTGSVGVLTPSFEYSIDNGSHWSPITTGLPASATTPKAVNTSTPLSYTAYSAVWNAKAAIDGTYAAQTKIRVTVDDLQGANRTATATTSAFAVDVKNPAAGSPSIYVDASTSPATVHLNATDDTTLQMCVTLDNSQTNCSAYSATTTLALATDPDTVYVIYRDAFGNTTAANAITPQTPSNLVIRDISNVQTSEYQLFITWAATSIPGGQFSQYRVYTSTNGTSYTQQTTISDRTINYYLDKSLAAGSIHYYKILATTTDGSVSYFSPVINATANGQGGGTDVVAPIISNVTISSVTTQSALISWDTDELSNSTVGYSTTAANFTTEVGVATMLDRASGSGRHTVLLNNLIPNTTYYLRVRSADPSGNVASDTSGGDGYIVATLAGPVISNVTTSTIDNTSATINWHTDIAADSTVMYSTHADMSSPLTMNNSTSVTDHSIQLTGLTLGTKYYYEVQSGVALDPNAGLFYSFTTTQDSSAPIISTIVVSPITDTEAVITWTTNERSTSQIAYGTTSGSYPAHSALDSSLNVQHAVTVTGLTAHTTYYFTITSVDASNNSVTSSEQSFQTHYQLTEQTPSNTPPVISGLTVQPIIDTQAVVQWSTDSAATTRVDYGTASGQLLQHVGPDGVFNKTHAITLPSLTAHTTYFYTVTSVDQWGNTVTSSEHSFTTLYTLVEQTPSVTPPTLSAITADPITDVTALIHWVSSSPASTQVKYGTQSGSYTTTTTLDTSLNLTHSVIVTGLTASSTYYFVVISTDQWGNTATSSEKTFSTAETTITMTQAQALIDAAKNANTDITPPSITAISVDSITTSSVIVHWNTNEQANSFIQFGTTPTDQTVYGNWIFADTHSITLRQLTPATTYSYNVVSADSHGNTTISPTVSFTTSTLPTTTLESQLQDQVQTIQQQAQQLPGPVISGQPKIDATSTGATVTWTTDKAANGFVAVASDTDYLQKLVYTQTVGAPDVVSTMHQVRLINLLPDTLYHIQVRSSSILGQQTSTTDLTFRTLKKIFEIENYSVATPGNDQATFRWTTSEVAGASVQIVPYRNNIRAVDELKTVSDDTKSLIHQVSVGNLEPAVRYSIELVSVNVAGQRATKTIDAFSTTTTSLPPLITNIHVDSALSPGEKVKVQTIVSWTTNTPSTSQVFYREGVGKADTELPNKTEPDPGYTKRHIVVITSFNPGSVYQLRVESKDSNGQVTTSKPLTMLTPQQERTVFQVISGAAQQIFGWTGAFKK